MIELPTECRAKTLAMASCSALRASARPAAVAGRAVDQVSVSQHLGFHHSLLLQQFQCPPHLLQGGLQALLRHPPVGYAPLAIGRAGVGDQIASDRCGDLPIPPFRPLHLASLPRLFVATLLPQQTASAESLFFPRPPADWARSWAVHCESHARSRIGF